RLALSPSTYFTPLAPACTSTRSLLDALPIFGVHLQGDTGGLRHHLRLAARFQRRGAGEARRDRAPGHGELHRHRGAGSARRVARSEEHTSELQSRENLVCRLLREKKKRSYAA